MMCMVFLPSGKISYYRVKHWGCVSSAIQQNSAKKRTITTTGWPGPHPEASHQ
jgi:hypothetical protein